MMKKLFVKLSMLLILLAMSVNAVWATNMSEMTDEQALTMGFWARLTAMPSTTTFGGGQVFVSEDEHAVEPTDESFKPEYSAEGWSDIYLASSLISATVDFKVYAKANAGSYFTGWSFTDGYTDLGVGNGNYVSVQLNPSSVAGKTNIQDYTVYAAFEQVKLKSYKVEGDPNTYDDGNGNFVCEQTVTFRAETPGFWALSSIYDVKHFNLPEITPKEGTSGMWSTSVNEWNPATNITLYGDYALLTVPVTFTAPNGNAAEYGAELVLETKAGVKMKVYLSARTTGGDYEAIRYNKSKVQQEKGDLSTLLTNAAADDIVKLNKDYDNEVELNKNITFDLNGYTLNNTLTVSGGNVTLAYSPYGGIVTNDVAVTGGKLTINGGRFDGTVTVSAGAELAQNGATFKGELVNHGVTTTTDGTYLNNVQSNGTLLVNGGFFMNDYEFSDPAITISGGTATIKRGTVGGDEQSEYGVGYYGLKSTGGVTTIEKGARVVGEEAALWNAGGSITVNGGKFFKPEVLAEGTITFNAGYFKHKDNEDQTSALGKQIWRNVVGPEAREGYDYFVGDQAAAQAANVSVCRIGHASYSSLEDALAYANNHLSEEVIIIMENDYTLMAGYYTIPANATLIVPMSDEQDAANPIVPRNPDGNPMPVEFRRLTLEPGVNMTVLGTIEVSCTQYGLGEQMGVPGGNYGHLILKPGSHVTLSNGSVLRAWGFVTGDGTTDADGNYLSGEIDARRGSTVREMFQMGDWKGGDISFTIAMEMPDPSMPNYRDLTHLFPVYTYFIQNVESPVKYHPGSALICATSVNVGGSINAYANDIKVVGKEGEAAMFLMDEMADAENTWVRKWYDAKNDKQVYDVNSGAKLGSVVIDLGELSPALAKTYFDVDIAMKLMLDSRSFVLPLTSNFKIHLLTGYMEFTQSTSCLPGMEVEVDKEAEVALVNDHTPGVAQGALYLYDADQWSFQNSQAKGYVGNSGKFGAIVRYSATLDRQPTVRDIRSPAAIGDAKLIVHGTFRSGEDCSVYTSWSKNMTTFKLDENGTGGASIISTNEDAGTFIFDEDAPDFDGVHLEGEVIVGFGPNVIFNYDHNDYDLETYPIQIPTVLHQSTPTPVFGFELCTPAKLRNADGTFTETEGTKANTSYCYMNDRWTTMQVAEEDPCFMKETVGGQTTYYAKPAEYVAVNATWDGTQMVGNNDHTFSDKDGAGRLFILMAGDCQWWEVEQKDNLYHCIHPNNDTYYYWDEEEGKWMEQRFTITWKNWDGVEIKSYTYDPNSGEPAEVPYSVTYGTMAEYLGENPTREPNDDYTYDFAGWSPALGPVTSNVTYTATYSKQPRKYAIIFTNEGGDEIERHLLTHNEIPVCENEPTKVGHTLVWEPAIAAVTGDAIYRATWLEEPPTKYEITFFDYDGTSILKQDSVTVGTMPTLPDDPAGKPATSEFTYVFHHWSPSPEAVSATSIKSYTAVYAEVAKKYTVIFQNENGGEIERHEYSYGETPVCSATPTKENTPEWTYQLIWDPQIQTVMGDATYKADFETLKQKNKYTVTLRSNIPGACTLTGAGTYDYNTMVSISATPAEGYEFVRWQETSSTSASLDPQALTADITLTAVLRLASLPDLPVGIDAEVTVDTHTDYNDVTITSNGITQSGQIINANNIILNGNADFVLQKSMERLHWYDVAVPWRVDATSGIFLNGSATPAVLGSDIDLYYYDGSVRATQGKVDACWIPVKAQSQKVLEPGRAYLFILYNTAVDQVTFRKQVGASLLTTETSVAQYDQTTGYPADAGWNGIANPSLFKAYLNAGTSVAQTINAAGDGYEAISANSYLVVGQPIYVQVEAPKSSVVADHDSYAPAPVRRTNASADPARYQLTITAEGANRHADRLFVQLDEEKEENTYVIGKDLSKFGTSTSSAQMWIDRYDAKLCLNTLAPQGDATSFPMTLSAPKAGEYTIAIEREVSTEAYDLYLTYDGTAIWNLSESAYTANLNQGADARYGLRIVARTPQICTGVDEAVVNAQGATRKVLVNEKVFIIRGEKVYTIDGQLVK